MPTRVTPKSARAHTPSSPKIARVHVHSSPKKCGSASALQLESKNLSELQRSKPSRCNISGVKRLQKRHLYSGRGVSHLGCARSFWANPFQVKRYGLTGAISKLEALFNSSPAMQRQLEQLSDRVLLCHCPLAAPCHGDVLIRAWEKRFQQLRPNSSSEQQNRDSKRKNRSPNHTTNQVRNQEEQAGEVWGNLCVWVEVRTKESCTTVLVSLLSREMAHREKGTATDARASKLQDTAEEFRNEAAENRSLCKVCLREGRQLPFRSSGGRATRASVRSV